MSNFQIYGFYVMDIKPLYPSKFKRWVLNLFDIKLKDINEYSAFYKVSIYIDGYCLWNRFKDGETYNAASTNKYGENEHWNVISIRYNHIVIESKKAIHFSGFGEINDLGRINIYKV